jgi:hypothetical protein
MGRARNERLRGGWVHQGPLDRTFVASYVIYVSKAQKYSGNFSQA